MTLTLSDWHNRFKQQARWTEAVRRYLFKRITLESPSKVLEVGCGTGALLYDFIVNYINEEKSKPVEHKYSIHVHGLDINAAYLAHAQQLNPSASVTLGDAHSLPYGDNSFALSFCHFLLLWVKDPLWVITEMRRVTTQGGYVFALAEPDYGGRIDYPFELVQIGQLQSDALTSQGAQVNIGRKLLAIFRKAGLEQVEAGLLGGEWHSPPSSQDLSQEWKVLRSDIGDLIPPSKLHYYQELDEEAWTSGERILFIPTFYACGRVPVID